MTPFCSISQYSLLKWKNVTIYHLNKLHVAEDQIYHLALPPATLMINLDHLWVIIETAPEITENAPGIKPENAPETAPSIKPETAPETALGIKPKTAPETALGIKPETAPETALGIKPEIASGIKLDHAPTLYPAHRMQEGL